MELKEEKKEEQCNSQKKLHGFIKLLRTQNRMKCNIERVEQVPQHLIK